MSYDMTKMEFDSHKALLKVTKYNKRKIIFHPLYNRKKFVKQIYEMQMKKELDYNNLRSFNEKLNGYKVNTKFMKSIRKLVNKHEVRDYISKKIGKKYLIEEYFCKDKITVEDLKKLPDSFVLKTTLGSGTNLIVKDKNKEDLEKICEYMNMLTKIEYGYIWGEFAYNYTKNKIIAEEYLSDKKGSIPDDLKCFCFQDNDGVKRKILYVERVVDGKRYRKLFDENWKEVKVETNFLLLEDNLPKPKNLKEILKIIDKLSSDFNFVRVDLFTIGERIYFGELTFIPTAGYLVFKNEEDNLLWGSYIGDNKT